MSSSKIEEKRKKMEALRERLRARRQNQTETDEGEASSSRIDESVMLNVRFRLILDYGLKAFLSYGTSFLSMRV